MARQYLLPLIGMFIIACGGGIGVPELIDPTGGESVSLPVVFVWLSVEDANGYRVEVDTTTEFASLVVSEEPDDTTYTVTNLDTMMYYWRVAALEENGDPGDFSDVDSFQVSGAAYPRNIIATVAAGNSPYSLDITPDDSEVWVNNWAQYDTIVYVISTASHQVSQQIQVSGRGDNELRITPNGQYAYMCASADTVGIIEISTSTYQQIRVMNFLNSFGYAEGPIGYGIALTQANDVIYAAHYDLPTSQGSIRKFDVAGGNQIDSVSFIHAYDVDLNHAENKLYAVSENVDHFYEINPTSFTKVDSVAVGNDPHFIVITDDDNYAFVTHLNDERIFVIDLVSFSVATTLDMSPYGGYHLEQMALTPDQNYLFAGGQHCIFVIDISEPANPTYVETVSLESGWCYDICFSSDGNYAYAVHQNEGVVVLSK